MIPRKNVMTQKADGYTLLMGAENPMLYKVMGLGDIDYSAFIPINILARGIPLVVARNDAPFDTFKEFVEYAQAHPGEVKIGSTGPGGLPSVSSHRVHRGSRCRRPRARPQPARHLAGEHQPHRDASS